MEPLAFAFTAFALLVLPPTNTVLALSSDELGAARVLQRVAIVVFGYVIAAPIALLAAPILQDHPIIEKAVKLVSAGWVVYLGYRL